MQRQLPILAEVHLAEVVGHHDVRYEGRTDLTAAITKSSNIEILRLSGQRAFTIEPDELSGKPTCLSWARRGELLLIGTECGLVDLFYTRIGKVSLGRGRDTDEDGNDPVTGVGTHVSLMGTPNADLGMNASHDVSKLGDEVSIGDWFDRLNIDSENASRSKRQTGTMTILPRALAKVNPSDVLPRLGAIPPPSKAGPGMPTPVLRSVQKDLHLLLNERVSHHPEGVEVSFISLQNGGVDSSIGELFNHNFKPKAQPNDRKSIHHCTDSLTGSYAILEANQPDQKSEASLAFDQMKLRLFDIPFATSGSVHTASILSSATQLKTLEQYITQTIETAVLDWNTLTTLPARFVASINETLEEKQQGQIDQQLYQLLLTGHCSDSVLEWLKEELAERGHKRWDHAMTTFYHAIIQLFEVNLLPALERCVLTASTLRGLATYYEGSTKFDVPPSFFTKIIEAAGCLHMIVHEALQIAGREERQFRAFSSWLRHQIDIAAAEPGSTAAVELAERDAMSTDVAKILSYLEEAFAGSKLQALIGRRLQPADLNTRLSNVDLASSTTSAAIHKARDTRDSIDDAQYIPLHLANLQKQVEACSAQMRRWQSTTWLPPEEIDVEIVTPLSAFDISMSSNTHTSPPSSVTTIAGTDASSSSIVIHTITAAREQRSSFRKTIAQDSWRIQLPHTAEEIIDIKLLSDRSVLCLLKSEDQFSLACVPPDIILDGANVTLSKEELEGHTVHVFLDTKFQPAYLYVSDNTRRKNVLVLDKRCQWWKVLRLPHDVGTNGFGDTHEDDDHDERDEGNEDKTRSPFGLDGSGEGMVMD
ncbi:anaphase-promoting complex, cyclosome, subunit 4-domain-containing protein [Elsinoe ampelina]|uniref:Anaphase-promoting complex subunit 4 n=1 Tax=Elsinoe ampelina TaxID=302913 RepID=A0A6A6GA95_9PEZI|nr:anaphase-promoting complex, cyclosome, subunit 4-domain-containing protein [Elsinoe ampelina]